MKKIPKGAEASNILVGEVDFLEKPFSAFIRLQEAAILGDLTEVPVPTRFLFIMLGPCGKLSTYHEIGRSVATIMSDEVFHDVAYKEMMIELSPFVQSFPPILYTSFVLRFWTK